MDCSFVLFLVERSALAGSGVGTEPAGFGRKILAPPSPARARTTLVHVASAKLPLGFGDSLRGLKLGFAAS